MKLSRKALSTALALGLCAVPKGAAHADGEQLVFVGFAGPRASLNTSVAGGTARTVYLRWDTTEGSLAAALPAGATLQLMRNGVELGDFPVGLRTPAAGEVATAYGGVVNARRRAEMVTRLDAVVRGEGGAGSAGVTSLTFDTALADFLDVTAPVPYAPALREQHEVWARIAARLDINIAALTGRGYVDTSPPAGVVRYDLVAVSGEVRKPLGTVNVDTSTEQVLGPAADLTAVTHELGRCDAPEDGRVQGVVALTWDHSGPNRSTRFVNALATGGYDVWRTTGVCGLVPPARDLRAEMAGLVPNGKGQISLPDLVKVNGDTLIDISQPPADGREPTPNPRSWRAAFSQFLEDRKALESAGFEAGEQVCYYIVAQDSSGNYGQTQALSTQVGDTLDPPAPWDIEAVPESSRADGGGGVALDDDRMVLRWASVDVQTYVADHRFDRVFCNLPRAQITGRLVEARDAAACGRGEGSSVNLDIDRYAIYRFESEADAQSFMDSDGDGYTDSDERAGNGPGMACNAAAGPAAAVNFKVGEIAAGDSMFRRLRGGRVEYEWADTVPAGTKGNVYFYRVAALGRTPQQVGAPGIPVRALFPDEAKPARPTEEEIFFGYCAPYAVLDSHPDPAPESGGRYAAYDTVGLASHVRFVCPDAGRENFILPGRALGEIELVPEFAEAPDGPRYAPHDSGLCQAIQQAPCAGNIAAEFLDSDRRLLGAVDLPFDNPFGCDRFANGEMLIPTLVQNQTLAGRGDKLRIGCDQGTGLVRPQDGDVVEGPITIALPLGPDECATLNVEREGQSFRLESKCGAFDTEWDPPAEGGELSCVALYKTNKNNQPSAVLNLPCVKFRPKKAPGVPIISRFTVPGTGAPAVIEWYGPEQAIGGVIVEMWRAGGGEPLRQTQFLGAEGRFGNGALHTNTLPHGAPVLVGSDFEEWCVQARSVGVGSASESGAQLSALTQAVCVSRRAPAAEVPTYLGWPAVPRPPQRSDLAAVYLTGDRTMAIPFASLIYESFCAVRPGNIAGGPECDPLAVPAACTVGAPPPGCGDSAACADRCLPPGVLYGGDTALCALARGALGENARFVAYRQSRDRTTGGLTPYEQVSPYLEKPFCRTKSGLDPLAPQRQAAVLNDPYLTLAPFDLGSGPAWHMTYIDRTPFIGGRDYRYQLVYFDSRGEIAAYADTQWITEVP